MVTANALHRAPAEVQRLRTQMAVARHQLAELSRYVTLLQRRVLSAVADSRTSAAAAYERGRADGYEAGWLACVAELKATDRGIQAALEFELQRWGPGGRSRFGDPRPGDFEGRP